MFSDRSLIPTEAVRLAALGLLAEAPVTYGELAVSVRRFISRLIGPSLDLMGTSLQLLRLEGLIELENAGGAESAPLRLTDSGRAELIRLLTSRVRAPINDVSKVVVALKLRFLDLLPPEERRAQIDTLIEIAEAERGRLADLGKQPETPLFAGWLDQDLRHAESRLAWLNELRAKL
ncbi:MAG: hypothetical protein EXQ89_02950 [Rhodospirillaceae bacterium]|nr:hypothetical protein [Rhodospirillaceae bacterium]